MKRALSERCRLIVVDDAQWLDRECFEFFQHMHDDPSTTYALLFVGGASCYEVLSREPMLDPRLDSHVRFAPLTPRQVLQVIPVYHSMYSDVDPALITGAAILVHLHIRIRCQQNSGSASRTREIAIRGRASGRRRVESHRRHVEATTCRASTAFRESARWRSGTSRGNGARIRGRTRARANQRAVLLQVQKRVIPVADGGRKT